MYTGFRFMGVLRNVCWANSFNNFKKCIIYIPANWFQLGKLDFNEDKTLPFGFKF